ncbi:TatD family hydrolase [Bacillus sp. B15-48]|uniref:TatD family hydrolase n=1 Tax=Bacillus sp. B15-48 TaxID=1548601 RepID=UPI00194015A0|nr:TatD family hydrolase [Bacillus sp. B15-48]MBM4762765.1 TatD family deoxyribonuclease [Bacillus sp. B15-48]
MRRIIDAHIHIDKYKEEEVSDILSDVTALISVSMDFQSCLKNLTLSKKYSAIKPCFGFHPEQELPSESQLQDLLLWIKTNKDEAVAIGEVGLPYYLRKKNQLTQAYEQYIEYLDAFIRLAKQLDLPIALHAVYDDAHIVCDLLEKHTVSKAHFHWFKGDAKLINRLSANEYFISITPDVVYEEEIRELVRGYPLELIMAETDGPWPFAGKFSGKKTRPAMIHDSIEEIAKIKKRTIQQIYESIYMNTKNFYIV